MERIKASGHQMGNHMCKDRPSYKLTPEKYEQKLLKCDKLLTQYGAFDDIPEERITVFPNESQQLKQLEEKEEFNDENNDSDSNSDEKDLKHYKWTRPGSGFFSSTMLDTAERNGYSMCLGNVYPFDPQIRFPWLNGRHVVFRTSPGSIIIIHDRPYTLTSLQYILDKLVKEREYKFLTLTQLANFK